MKEDYGKWENIEVESVGTLMEDEIKEIMKLRDDGKTSQEIATFLGRTLLVINRVIALNSNKVEKFSEDETSIVPIGEFKPDSLKDIEESDIVQLSRRLLNSIIESSGLISPQKLTDQKIKEARLIVSFINATAGVMRTKMSFFKMVGLDEKVKAVKEHNKNL